MCSEKTLVLASTSPRRRELLTKMGYSFEICAPEVDEHVTGEAKEIVAVLAKRKALAAAAHCPHSVIVASDTLVSMDGTPLGKPEDAADARRMLRALSCRTHEVFSGVCVIDTDTNQTALRVARTGVTFKTLSNEEIDAYIATGEPMDKAGAYGIQGGAGAFVTKLDGSFENVMGFPVDDVKALLREFGI